MVRPLHIGVLALQGAFREHRMALERCGAEVSEIRRPLDPKDRVYKGLDCFDGMVLPGGESTTMGILLRREGLLEAITACGRAGMPLYGSCAGLILLCREIEGPNGEDLEQPRFGLLKARVRRNAFGRQKESFETNLSVRGIAEDLRAVFIRAPLIVKTGEEVEILARVTLEGKDFPVAVRQGHIMATSFHPELTQDCRFHQAFLESCRAWRSERRVTL